MGFPLIAFSNWADIAIYSGGAWRSTLPLVNLSHRQMGRLARTVSVDLAATQFDVDIGIDHLVRVVGFLNHNIKPGGDAKYRLRGSNQSDFSAASVDSGWLPVWASVYPPNEVEWESDNFWFGSYRLDEVAGYPWHLIHVLNASKSLRYWRLEFDDQSNPDGYIHGGRLFIGDAWQPINGIPYGASLGWEDPTPVAEALSGTEYFDPRQPIRIARIITHFMGDDEAYSKAFEIQRRSGTWKEVVYIHDPDDTVHSIRRRWPGRLRTLGPIENPYPDANQAAWEIKESIP